MEPKCLDHVILKYLRKYFVLSSTYGYSVSIPRVMSPVLLREGIYRYPRIIAGGIIYCTHVRVQYIIVGSYVPSPANTVDILAVRHVKRGIETVGFRTGLYNHCQKVHCITSKLK